MLVTIGRRSSIAREMFNMTGGVTRNDCDIIDEATPLEADQYLICSGYLAGEDLTHIDHAQSHLTWDKNYVQIARFLDRLFKVNPYARVCVIGSHSGFEGSFDMAYAGAKAAMHKYIETKKLAHSNQLLVGLAPHIIWDSGMTQKREDLKQLAKRREQNRTGRWLMAKEVASVARYVLFDAPSTISNQMIRIRP